MRGRGGAAAGALKMGEKDVRQAARRKQLERKKLKKVSPFATIHDIPLLDNEPHFALRRQWIGMTDWVRWNVCYAGWFGGGVMFLIFLNCVFLSMESPETSSEGTTLYDVLDTADFVFNLLFTIEVAIKWVGLGFWGQYEEVYGPDQHYTKKFTGYFNDWWNVMDFVIVLGGWFSMGTTNVSALRVLRVLRPLRNLSHIDALQQIITTFFDSIEGLLYVVLLLSFFLLVFGIIGLQLFKGILHQQCFAMEYCPTPELCIPLYKESKTSHSLVTTLTLDQYNSINGAQLCSKNSDCDDGSFCVTYGKNPDGRMSSFDDIMDSVVNCFVSITLDWATLMMQVQDAYGMEGIPQLFWFSLTFIVAFFALNLVLAVVCNAFGNGDNVKKQFPKGVTDTHLYPEMVDKDNRNKLCERLVKKRRRVELNNDKENQGGAQSSKQSTDVKKDRKLNRTKSRSVAAFRFVEEEDDDDDAPEDVDAYLSSLALDLTRPEHISDNERMGVFFHNYQIGNFESVAIKIPANDPNVDNFPTKDTNNRFKDHSYGELRRGQPVNVKNLILFAKGAPGPRLTKYHGASTGVPVSESDISGYRTDPIGRYDESNETFEVWARVQYPCHGWIELEKLVRLTENNMQPKNKEFPLRQLHEKERELCEVVERENDEERQKFEEYKIKKKEFDKIKEKNPSAKINPPREVKFVELFNTFKTPRLAIHQFDSNFMSEFIKNNYDIAQSNNFSSFIMAIIVLNAVTMSLTWDDATGRVTNSADIDVWDGLSMESFLEQINFVFTIIFTVEMIIKHIGLGLNGYWADSWNKFDGCIVILSWFNFVIDIAFSGGGGGGISSLRAFRLFRVLRILRLLNQFDGLRRQIKSVANSIGSVIWLLLLLTLFLFTFGILGVQMFGGYELDLYGDRYSFSNIYFAMLTLFQCITGDSWRSVQADVAEKTRFTGITIFFMTVMVIGSFMLLNIFIAILLTNMTPPNDPRINDLEDYLAWAENEHGKARAGAEREDEMKLTLLAKMWQKREAKIWNKSRRVYISNRDKQCPMGHSLGIYAVDHPLRVAVHHIIWQDWFLNFVDFCILLNCLFLALESNKIQAPSVDTYGDSSYSGLENLLFLSDLLFTFIFVMEMVLKVFAMGFGETPSGQVRAWEKPRFGIPPFASNRIYHKRDKKPEKGRKKKRDKEGIRHELTDFSQLLMDELPDVQFSYEKAHIWQKRCARDVERMLENTSYINGAEMTAQWLTEWNKPSNAGTWTFGINLDDPFSTEAKEKLDFYSEVDLNRMYIYDMVWTKKMQPPGAKTDHSYMIIHFYVEGKEEDPQGHFEVRFAYDVTGLDEEDAPQEAQLICKYWTWDMEKTKTWLKWNGVEEEDETKRKELLKMKKKGKENNDPEIVQILQSVNLSNLCTTAYWSDNWNRLDAIVVFFSILSIVLPSVKMFRALRAIRPLRLAVRNPQIKVVVKTLISAIQPAVFALVLCSLIFYVLSIFGVSLFCGKYRQCVGTDEFGNDIARESFNREQCDELRYVYNWDVYWSNYPFNFDDVFSGMLAVFVVASGDTWHAIMYKGMDAPETIGAAPTLNGQSIWGVYFVMVQVFAGFFAFNFVVSAIVDQFIAVKAEKDGTAFQTKAQLAHTRTRQVRMKFRVERVIPRPKKQKVRQKCYDIVNYGPKNQQFDNAITVCILLNTFFMCLDHYGRPKAFGSVLDCADNIFIGIFTLEAVLKIIAYRFPPYWKDPWNKFDFIVVILSYPPILMGLVGYEIKFGTSVFRVFRIGRVLRLIKKARKLNLLFQTLVMSIPALWNVGCLLFIVYFIFGVIGVSLFSDGQDPDGRLHTEHRNFENWWEAFNLLYIGSTGDSWTNPWQGLKGNLEWKNQGHVFVVLALYNVLFFVFLGLIMLNLFIGVILEMYDQNNEINMSEEKMLALHRMTKLWNKRDTTTLGYLPVEVFMGILKDTPWPVGLANHMKNEHADNLTKLSDDSKYAMTRDRFERDRKNQLINRGDTPEKPTKEEITQHFKKLPIELVRWKKQKVWVVEFEQVILSFATRLLEYRVEHEHTESKHSRKFIWEHWAEDKEVLYERFLEGEKARSPLGLRGLDHESDDEDEDDHPEL